MIVRCIGNNGNFLSRKTLEAGTLSTAKFPLTIGDTYIVYGISLWKDTVNYLTMDSDGAAPFWHPAELFNIIDNSLPPEWYYNYFNQSDYDLNAIWGYKELVMDVDHYDNLLEREKEALLLFFKRKREIDELIYKEI